MSLLSVVPAHARLKYYRYNNNIPMAEMTLRMMIAAGVLDEIPAVLVQDGNPLNRLHTYRNGVTYQNASLDPYSGLLGNSLYGNPYSNYYQSPYSSLYGRLLNRSPYAGYGAYGLYSNPLPLSPYGYGYGDAYGYPRGLAAPSVQNPWGWQQRSYPSTQWGQSWNATRGYPGYPGSSFNTRSNPWSSPWTGGGWPGFMTNPAGAASQSGTVLPPPSAALTPMQPVPQAGAGSVWGAPVMHNAIPVTGPVNGPMTQWRRSLVQPYVSTGRLPLGYGEPVPAVPARRLGVAPAIAGATPAYAQPQVLPGAVVPPSAGQNIFTQQLQGLWVTNDGEYLGLRDDRFLWSDGHEQYESGTIAASAEILQAHSQGATTPVTYRYRYSGDELMTLGQDGGMKVYRRMPVNRESLEETPE